MRVIVLVLFLLLIFSFLYGAVITIGPNKEILVDGKPFFPIMQWLQSRSRMADEKQYGINVFVGQGDSSTALQYCDEAKLQGVWAVPSWDASQVDSVKNHPALLGWVFGDEPDLQSNQVPPSAIQTQYNEIKSKDPNHITFLTLTAGFYSEFSLPAWMGGSDAYYYEYPKYTDVIGFDLYPIYGWCRVDWVYRVGNACDELKNKYGKGQKSLYTWIECAKTSGQWCDISSREPDDGPYDYEIKCEIWHAIVKGANAIGYFTHSWECPGYTQWCVSTSQGEMLKKENAKITALTNVLCSSNSSLNITKNVVGVGGGNGRVDILAKEYGGNLYIIAVNVINITGTADTQQVTFTVPGLSGTIQVYDEGRSINPSGNSFTDTFTKTNPVHIYVISSSSSSGGGVNPLDTIRVYPNPFKIGEGKTLKIDNITPPNVKLKIYTSNGETIRELNENEFNNLGYILWDGKDSGGKEVSAGIYYYVVEDENGNKKTGKIGVNK